MNRIHVCSYHFILCSIHALHRTKCSRFVWTLPTNKTLFLILFSTSIEMALIFRCGHFSGRPPLPGEFVYCIRPYCETCERKRTPSYQQPTPRYCCETREMTRTQSYQEPSYNPPCGNQDQQPTREEEAEDRSAYSYFVDILHDSDPELEKCPCRCVCCQVQRG